MIQKRFIASHHSRNRNRIHATLIFLKRYSRAKRKEPAYSRPSRLPRSPTMPAPVHAIED